MDINNTQKRLELQVRSLDNSEADLKSLKLCFDNNGKIKDFEHWKWLYHKNPQKKHIVNLAIDKIKNKHYIAAVYSSIPFHFKMGNRIKTVALSLDALTDRKYRRLGLFTMLARSVYKLCYEEKVDFVYAFPNTNSEHGVYNRLEWKNVCMVPALIKPLQFDFFTKPLNMRGNWLNRIQSKRIFYFYKKNIDLNRNIKEIRGNFDERYDLLWKTFSKYFNIGVVRDCNYLNWRFVASPREYRIKYYEESDNLIGFIAYRSVYEEGSSIGYIMELIYSPKDLKAGVNLLRSAISDLYLSGCNCVKAFCFPHSPNYPAFKKCRFISFHKYFVSKKGRTLGVKSIYNKNELMIKNPTNWYLSYCDSDTV